MRTPSTSSRIPRTIAAQLLTEDTLLRRRRRRAGPARKTREQRVLGSPRFRTLRTGMQHPCVIHALVFRLASAWLEPHASGSATVLAASPPLGDSTLRENGMLNRRVRNLAVTAMTIVSATVLIALGGTSAYATSPPICSGGAPKACIQVFGSGLVVKNANGWIWNNSSRTLTAVHVEDYFNYSGAQGPTALTSNFMNNCNSPNLSPGTNSPNCSTGDWAFGSAVWVCAAAWQHRNGIYYDLGWRCTLVHR